MHLQYKDSVAQLYRPAIFNFNALSYVLKIQYSIFIKCSLYISVWSFAMILIYGVDSQEENAF